MVKARRLLYLSRKVSSEVGGGALHSGRTEMKEQEAWEGELAPVEVPWA